jgi:hypothetical protein
VLVGSDSVRNFSSNKKNGPIPGATFQEATNWWVMSGEAIVSVPPAGTVWDVTRRKCEGHGAEFAASLLERRDAFAAPKAESCVMWITRGDKYLRVNDLV